MTVSKMAEVRPKDGRSTETLGNSMSTTSYKFTIDRNLLNQAPAIPSMDVLKRWAAEGKVELVEAEPKNIIREAPVVVEPVASRFGRGKFHKTTKSSPSAKARFEQMAAILFPFRDTHRLNRLEINDVSHLVVHLISGNKYFITANKSIFIEGGRRESLRSAFGVVAMTPEEAVGMLKGEEGWS